jgi:hypothetical protein
LPCRRRYKDLVETHGPRIKVMIEQSNLEKNLQNKLRIEDLKIVVGQLESQKLPAYYSV